MKMHRLGLKAMRVGRVVAATLGLTAATSAFGIDFRPFPTALSLPRDVAANTVVARAYLTPQKLCGEGTCRLVNFLPISMVNLIPGDIPGLEVNGPAVATEIKGLRMQILVNGTPQTRLYEDRPPIVFSSPIEIQLLRDSSPELVSGASTDPIQFWFFTKTTSGSDKIRNYIRFNTRLTRIEGSCSVPSQTVELQPALARSLTGIGATAGERSFQININGCPKGYNKIFYRLKPVGDTIETSAGVLPLSPKSTAKGVRIRVTDSAGAAVVFDTSTRIDDYNKDTGGSFSIPMRVSYVQTEANVTPGTVNGAMSVLMEYQ
jgi:type 1 fimbria pilin